MPTFHRFRRLRSSAALRDMVSETRLSPAQFVMPFFVRPGRSERRPILSLPGHSQLSVDQLLREAETVQRLGIRSVILFGIPEKKDAIGSDAISSKGIIQQAVRALKKNFPKLVVMTDLCFCEYTSHGHCGVIKKTRSGVMDVDNDATLNLIQKAAIAQAQAGSDFVAPSGMMDGAVGAIRSALDKKEFHTIGILAYSAKFSSNFYGPFRLAAESTPKMGNRKTYQMDPPNIREALREMKADLDEGADMLMVKPALSYLDVLVRARLEIKAPLAAYNVSGEYAMVKAAEKMGWLDSGPECRTALEILTSIKRAGADLIITYHALEAARALRRL